MLTSHLTGFVLGQSLSTSGVTGSAALSTTAVVGSAAGTYPITVTGVGTLSAANYDFPAGSFGSGVLSVTQGSSAGVVVSSTASSSTYGQAVSFTVNVSPPGSAPTPTGSVQFLVDGANFGSPVALSSGQATLAAVNNLGAGSHTITADYLGDVNYGAANGSMTQTVAKAHLGVVPDSLSRSVGQSNPTLTTHYTGFVLGETATTASITGSPVLTTAASLSSPTGTYPITVSGAGTLSAANYDFPAAGFGSASLVVSAGTVSSVVVGSTLPSSTYGQSLSFTVSVNTGSGAPTPTGTVQFVVDGTNYGLPVVLSGGQATVAAPSGLGAGTHAVTVNYLGDSSYATANGSFAQTVAKVHLGVVADNFSRAVGQSNPSLTAHYTGFVLGQTATTASITGSPALATSAVVGSPVGTYPITVSGAGTLSAANYDFPAAGFVAGTLSVTPGSALGVVVSSNEPSATYGDSVTLKVNVNFSASGPTPTGSVQFVVDGTNVGSPVALAGGQATVGAPSGLGAGSHTIQAKYLGDADYVAANGSFTQVVGKAHLAVVPDSLSRSVGQANPTLTAQLTGFVLGQSLSNSGVTGSAGLITTAVAGSAAGVYPITVSNFGTLSAANYDFPASGFGSGALSVTQGSVAEVVVGTSAPNLTYGQAVSFTVTVNPVGGAPTPTGSVQLVVDGSNFGSPVALVGGQATIAAVGNLGAGSHTVTANYLGDVSYQPANGSMTQTVAKAHLAIVADDQSRAVGQSNPSLTAHYAGFVPGENAASANITGNAVLATSAIVSSPVGTYPITVSGAGTLSAANYDFPAANFNPGTLSVTPGAASGVVVSSNEPSATYGDSVTLKVNVNFSASGPTPTGSVQFVVDGTNYGVPVSLTSGQATVAAPSGLLVGNHTIQANYLGDANYVAANGSFTQVVGKAHLAVVPDSLSRSVGQANPTLTSHLAGFVLGQSLSTSGVTGSAALGTTAVVGSAAGAYPITVSGAGTLSAANYDFPAGSFGSGALSVTQGTVSGVVASSTAPSTTYGQSATFTAIVSPPSGGPAPTGMVQFVVDGVNFGSPVALTGGQATIAEAGSLGAGTHSVSANYLGDNSYTAATGSFTQTVAKAHLAVVPDDISRSLGQLNPTLTVHFTGFVLGQNAVTAGILGSPLLVTSAVPASVAGTYPITVSGVGSLSAANYDFPSASFGAGTLTVAPGTVLGVVANSTLPNASYGQAVSFSAIVNVPSGGPAATGSVQFVLDGSNLGSPVTLTSGQATIAAPGNLGAGSHTLSVTYLGDANYANAGSNSLTQMVAKAHLAIVPDNVTRGLGESNPTLTAHFAGFVLGDTAASAGVSGNPVLSTTALATSPVGTYPIAVTSAGTLSASNYDFPAAEFGTGSLSVSKGGDEGVVVGSNLESSSYGQAVTFTVTVSGSGVAPTGMVQFVLDGTNLGSPVPLSSGQALIAAPSRLAAGSHTVTANYLGDSNYSAQSGSFTQSVAKVHLAIVPDSLARSVGQANPTLSAHFTGFLSGEDAVSAGITGSPALTTTADASSPVGSYAITVSGLGTLSAGNYDFPAASFGSGALTVNQGVATVVAGSSLGNSIYGQAVTFTANVNGPAGGPAATGLVQFVLDGTNLGSPVSVSGGQASLAAPSALGAGTHTVQANYLGDTNYATVKSSNITQGVAKAHLAVIPDSLSRGIGAANPTLSAHLTGFVLGEDANAAHVTGSPVLSTSAVPASPAGTYPISVTSAGTLSAGNYDFPAASFGTGVLAVTQGASAGVVAGSTLESSTYGQAVTFQVSVNPGVAGPTPTGSVQFLVDGVDLGAPATLSGGQATLSAPSALAVGNHTIAANYLGDGNYAPSSGNFTQTVAKAHLAIVPDNATRTTSQSNPTLTAHFTGFVLGEDASSAGITGSPTLTTTAVAASAAGSYAINVTGAGTLSAADYDFPAADFGAGTLTVSQDSATGTVVVVASSSLPDATYGQSVTFQVSVNAPSGSPGATGSVQFLVDGAKFGAPVALASGHASLAAPVGLAAGTHAVEADYLGDPSYSPAKGTLTQSVAKAHLTIVPDSAVRVYGQPNPTFTAHFVGFVLGENASTAKVTGNPVLSSPAVPTSPGGAYPITVVSLGSLSAKNYDFPVYGSGALTVMPAPVTVESVGFTNVKINKHKTERAIVVQFSDALQAGSAGNVGNYTLSTVAKGKKQPSKRIALATASYNAAAHTVVLVPRAKLAKSTHVQLKINGAGILDNLGRALDGDHDGQAGGIFLGPV